MMDDEAVSVNGGELRSRTLSREQSISAMDYEDNNHPTTAAMNDDDDGMTTSSAEKKRSSRLTILWNRKACLLGIVAIMILAGMGISIATNMVRFCCLIFKMQHANNGNVCGGEEKSFSLSTGIILYLFFGERMLFVRVI